jgi:hypothetical protein
MKMVSVFLVAFFLIGFWDQTNGGRPIHRHLSSNGLGKAPQMGWNSWNHFGCNIDENIIRGTADAMVSTGLSKVGYEYVNIDDCWGELNRDAQVLLQIQRTRENKIIRVIWLLKPQRFLRE